MKKKLFLYAAYFFLAVFTVKAQAPFVSEIQQFKKTDSVNFPQKAAILFVGSSSFTKWTDIADYFPGYPLINRGFGGSALPEVIRYANDIIFPYQPKQIIIYCGENDLAEDSTVTGEIVFSRFTQLFNLIRKQLPIVPIVYISMKPSPSREPLWPKMTKGNLAIKNFISKQTHANFIDVWPFMFRADGTINKDIFLSDQLHMNAKGYAIWQKIITPFLLK